MTRWRVASRAVRGAGRAGGDAGIGRPCWRLDLVRQRGGDPFSWIVEAQHDEGRLALPAIFRDRSAAPDRPDDRPAGAASAAA